MALKLTNDKVLMGKVLPVFNLGKRKLESEKYFAVKIEDESGKKEEWLLFTEKELERTTIDMGYITEMWKPGRVHPHNIGGKKSYAVKLLVDNGVKTVLIGQSYLDRARERAKKNPEDIPSQSAIADLLD